MIQVCNRRMAGAALGAALLTLIAACSDAPSGPRRPPVVERNSRVADDTDPVESVRIRAARAVLTNGRLDEVVGPDQLLRVRQGVAMVELASLAPDAAAASEITNRDVVALRVSDRGVTAPAFLRKSRFEMRLPDGRVAVVTRDRPADGPSSLMSVQVGDDEWRWQRTWERRNGRYLLLNSAVETRRGGQLLTRNVVSVSARRLAGTPADRTAPDTRLLVQAMARFGSIASTVLLPKALRAQSDAGKRCNTASLALNTAWTTWRVATVAFFASLVVGGTFKATGALFIASAAVDAAEANYIDCYVMAASEGVPDANIARPPVEDEV